MQSNQKSNKKRSTNKPRQKGGQTVKIPAAQFVKVVKRPPRISTKRDGKITVCNEEYVADIVGSQEFTALTLQINPGLSGVFPWLANIANNYEFYQFKKLMFHYRPTVGTTTGGQVFFAPDFDAADLAPINKSKLMSYSLAKCGPLYSPLTIPMTGPNLKMFGNQKFTRPGVLPSGTDVKTYDVANLHYCAETNNVGTAGMLFVSYEVDLMTPQTPAADPWMDSASLKSDTVTKAAPFSAAVLTASNDQEPILAKISDTAIKILKAGQYLVDFAVQGTGLSYATMLSQLFPIDPDEGSWTYYPLGSLIDSAATSGRYSSILNVKKNDIQLDWASPVWTTLTSAALRFAPYASVNL